MNWDKIKNQIFVCNVFFHSMELGRVVGGLDPAQLLC